LIDRIIEWSAHNKFWVLLLTLAAALAGFWAMTTVPLDAIPDLSDTQVIIVSRWDRGPDIVEDQVTYPIVTSLLGAPKVKDIRGFSDFGYSYVYVIFEEGTDIYWARSRILEYLTRALPHLPSDVKPEIGPDATGVGWVFQYALIDTSGTRNLAELRSLQDYYLRYHLQSVPGVAEVAPLGGFVRQYQVNLDPNRLQTFNISVDKVVSAVRSSNSDVGGRLVDFSGREYMIRGRGYLKSVADLANIVLTMNASGAPVRVQDVGNVVLGPDIRRGVSDLDGKGEAVSGIIVMRAGENALNVIERVKAKIKEIEPGLPAGVKIATVYDRSDLILGSVNNLKRTLVEELIVISAVIILFLLDLPSAIVPIVTIPIAVLIAFLPMRLMGMSSNIMSLGGIAIAIGALVDASIVVVEQTHKKLEGWKSAARQGDWRRVIVEAVKEVAGPSFFALLIIAVSFLPVLALEAQEGRLFKPLAYMKSFSMVGGALLAITLDPALRLLITRVEPFRLRPHLLGRTINALLVGRIHAEDTHPISRFLIRAYTPVLRTILRFRWVAIVSALALMAATASIYRKLGSEFMPPLNEGVLLYMPTTVPGISVQEAQKVLQLQDRILMQIPEVDRVFGKAGRAETATDPAPLSMMETLVQLKPESQWRKVTTWYGHWPQWAKSICRHIEPDHISLATLVSSMDAALQIPGVSNSWTMPIRGRIDMQATGIRTPIGIKVFGPAPQVIEEIGKRIETVVSKLPDTRSVFAERSGSGYFLDFDLKRDQLARYGLTVDEAQAIVMNAIGGDNVTTTIEGRERYPVNVRYMRDFRSSRDQMERATLVTSSGRQVPMAEIADIRVVVGPSMIRSENGLPAGYVYIDVATSDLGGYVKRAQRLVRDEVAMPPGYSLTWSGQYEALQRVRDRLTIIVPITVVVIIGLLYGSTRSAAKTAMILLAVPFSAVGAIWLLFLLGYNMSIAVWLGLIALMGVDAETGIFMLLYLDLAYEDRKRQGRMNDREDLRAAISYGAVKRIRPKIMTVTTLIIGLLPIMWSIGTGADVMKRIAAPMLGGILTSLVLELALYPAIYEMWKWHAEVGRTTRAPSDA
jgi:copper/silver efflux system protein